MSVVMVGISEGVLAWMEEIEILADLPNRQGVEREWMEALTKAARDPNARRKVGMGARVVFLLSPAAATALADELDERRRFDLLIPPEDRGIRLDRIRANVKLIRDAIKNAKEGGQ